MAEQKPNLETIQAEVEENPFVARFEAFFESQYKKQIELLVSQYPEKRSLNVDFKELEHFDFELADKLLENPDYVIEASEVAIKRIDIPSLEVEEFAPHVRFFNLPKDAQPLLRDISSAHLGKLICVEGIVRQITDVLPKLKLGVFECRRCGNKYRVPQFGTMPKSPSFCECKHRDFALNAEESEFIDNQKIEVQEPLEQLRGSEQAVNLEIQVTDDMVNRISAGDRTKIVGVLRLREPKDKKLVYYRYLEAVHLEETMKDFEEVEISKEEEEEIKALSKREDIYSILTQSIAPAIYGHEIVKQTIALQLFGGVKKFLPDGSNVRGNIHILLVGDPGTAKCVSGNTNVLLSNGTQKPIKEIVEDSLKIQKFELNDGFYSDAFLNIPLMNENCKVIDGQAVRAYKRKPDLMFEISTRAGKKLRTTHTHPFFVLENGKVKAKKVRELKKGEFIASPRIIKLKNENPTLNAKIEIGKTNAVHINLPNEVSKEFAQFIGFMLAEGYTLQRETTKQVRFTNSDKELIECFEFCAQKLFNLAPKKEFRNNATVMVCDNTELGRFLDLNVPEIMQKSKERNVPEIILKCNDEIVKWFLKAFIDAEGTADKRSRTIEVSSASEKLIDNLQLLLNRIGIISLKKEIWNIATNGKMKEKQKYFKLAIRGKFAKKYVKEIGFFSERKQKRAEEFLKPEKSLNTNIDIIPNLAKELIFVRKKLGLSQFAFNFPRSSYQHYEKGDRNPGREKLQSIVSTFLEKFHESKIFDKELDEKILNLFKLSMADIFWDEIISVKPIENEEWVYDIEVKGTHNFISNQLFSHNSMMLLATDRIAPKSIYTAGKSSSGVGLTASAVKDDFGEGGWTLKAGALVLASGGMAMVDEFDKMTPEDRDAMHEALEQQTVSVAKAGIVAKFKTDTSVLAAANPKFSRFDPFTSFIEQINLPATLISRFDLFFMIRDVLDRKKDEEMAAHILRTHKVGEIILQERLLGKKIGKKESQERDDVTEQITPIISPDILKKYISYARQKIVPIMTDEAINTISEFYVKLRDQGRKEGQYSATHRQLEAMVRLSEAGARVRLSERVENVDAERAINLFRASLQDMVVDPETGKIDIDIITTGITHSQITQLKNVLNIIKEKAQEMDAVPVIDVMDAASAMGIEKEKTNEIIGKLKTKGEIYEPRHGFLKPTQKS